MVLSSAAKPQDKIGWYNFMWVQIARHSNKWKSEYIKEVTFSNTGINWTICFIEKFNK